MPYKNHSTTIRYDIWGLSLRYKNKLIISSAILKNHKEQ